MSCDPGLYLEHIFYVLHYAVSTRAPSVHVFCVMIQTFGVKLWFNKFYAHSCFS